MSQGERYVLLGLAPARAGWFASLAQWATSATIAAEFIKCVSAEEVRARLASGRRHSALLIDASTPALDRDLVEVARAALTPVVVVTDGRSPAFSRADLGVAGILAPGFDRDDLLDVLSGCCEPIGQADRLPPTLGDPDPALWLGQLYTVCGPGGTGVSTLAIALAQGLSADARNARRVLLADLDRRADQAMLHDAVELGPGLQELVESHRISRPGPAEVRTGTFDVPRRGYRLLLGLRRPDAWPALRPRAIDATVEGLRRAFQVVVADVEGDFEGASDGGSADVEERNHLARCAALNSSVVVAVGTPGMKGVHSLARLVRSLTSIGVAPERIVAVFNRSPRNPTSRASLSRAFADLLEEKRGTSLASPVHVPERKIEDLLQDVAPLPPAIVDPLVKAVRVVSERQADLAPTRAEPTRIVPGSLGSWSESARG